MRNASTNPTMSDERLTHLEARFAWLEAHVVEQDKVMLELGEQLRRLRAELKHHQERAAPTAGIEPMADADERPPHY
jgi:uncharacterized coiled-coil protein SlyX